jgi:hypothetical protein
MNSACAADPTAGEPFPQVGSTVADVVDFLRTVTEGPSAEFAQSLVRYYDKHGELTAKQFTYAYRMNHAHVEREMAIRSRNASHDWVMTGSENYYNNSVLGTYSYSDFFCCSKCGAIGERHYNKNYSGD